MSAHLRDPLGTPLCKECGKAKAAAIHSPAVVNGEPWGHAYQRALNGDYNRFLRGEERYTFHVGIARLRTVTVYGKCLAEADMRARRVLDLRAERAGEEAPVRWDLERKL